MATQGKIGDQLRERIRTEREWREWTQSLTTTLLRSQGINIGVKTLSKIETGDRAILPEELNALADLFGMSVDALMGRNPTGADLMWVMSKLTSNAQKTASEVRNLYTRIDNDLKDVCYYANSGATSVKGVLTSAQKVLTTLHAAAEALTELSEEFPLMRRQE